MMNFRNHPEITEVVIPDDIQLSSTDFSNMFSNMKNLKTAVVPYEKILQIIV